MQHSFKLHPTPPKKYDDPNEIELLLDIDGHKLSLFFFFEFDGDTDDYGATIDASRWNLDVDKGDADLVEGLNIHGRPQYLPDKHLWDGYDGVYPGQDYNEVVESILESFGHDPHLPDHI